MQIGPIRFIFTTMLGVAVLLAAAPGGLSKELNPLQGGFEPEEIAAKVGATVNLTLKIDPLREFEKVKLTLKVPKGLKLIKGKPEILVTDLKPKEKKKFTFVFNVLEPEEQELWARATVLGLSPQETVSRSYLAIINKEEKPQDFEIKEDKEGRKIRVHDVPSK